MSFRTSTTSGISSAWLWPGLRRCALPATKMPQNYLKGLTKQDTRLMELFRIRLGNKTMGVNLKHLEKAKKDKTKPVLFDNALSSTVYSAFRQARARKSHPESRVAFSSFTIPCPGSCPGWLSHPSGGHSFYSYGCCLCSRHCHLRRLRHRPRSLWAGR
jgi:hypothetical protein